MKYISSTIISLFMGSLIISGLLSCGGSSGNGGSSGGGTAVTGSTVDSVAASNAAGAVASFVAFTALGAVRGVDLPTLLTQTNGEISNNITCAFSGDSTTSSFQVTCNCGAGGAITVDFDEPTTQETCISGEGETISLTTTGTSTYSDCVVSECGESVTLNGSDSFNFQGQVSTCTGAAASFSETVQTASNCSGMTATTSAGTNTIGYNIVFSGGASETTEASLSTSGNFCIDGQNVSFNDQTEFEQLLDPDGLCDSS